MNVQVQIPEGYLMDSKGRLVPEASIKPIDIERDALVARLKKKANQRLHVTLELHCAQSERS